MSKGPTFHNWDGVMAFALALPGAEESTSYGRPAVKVRGKAFVYPGREAGSFAISSPLEEKELQIERDGDADDRLRPCAGQRPLLAVELQVRGACIAQRPLHREGRH